MNVKSIQKTVILTLVFSLIPSFPQASPSPLVPETILVKTIPAETGFRHVVGKAGYRGWEMDYRRDRPGYALASLHDPLFLEPGLHRMTFYLRRGNYPQKGLLHDAYGVFRLEVWDVTEKEKLLERELQIADFPKPNQYVERWVEFSTRGRKGHSFEPRVYWIGLANGEIERVDVTRYGTPSPRDLEEKALRLGALLEKEFIDNRFVVSRKKNGDHDETGDATTYTGWYAASLAWRFALTRDLATQDSLENALHALHTSIKGTYDRPILARYVSESGQPYPTSSSKDSYAAFFFSYAAAAPHVKNPALKKQMADDAQRLASRFIKEDLSIREGETEIMSLSPYFSERVVKKGIDELIEDKEERHDFLKALKRANSIVPFGDAWPGSKDVIRALKNNDGEKLFQLVVPTANGLLDLAQRVRDLLREEYREDLFPKRTYLTYPGKKLETVITQMLKRFPPQRDGRRIVRVSDVKVLASNALLSLEIIKAAYEVSKNTQFLDYYHANLYSGDGLLKTALDWTGLDETLIRLTAGNPAADHERRGYLSPLALAMLIPVEKNPAVKESYVALLKKTAEAYEFDDNPMMAALVDAMTGKKTNVDFVLRALDQYPENRRGYGKDYWNLFRKEIGDSVGGGLDGRYSAEPLPVSHRPKDSFLWQRNARRLYGDDVKDYPPTDFLFVYWFSRYHKLIPAPEPQPMAKQVHRQ